MGNRKKVLKYKNYKSIVTIEKISSITYFENILGDIFILNNNKHIIDALNVERQEFMRVLRDPKKYIESGLIQEYTILMTIQVITL